MPGVADERHLVFECPAMQLVSDQFAHLFGDDSMTMQVFMWQDDLHGVTQACLLVLLHSLLLRVVVGHLTSPGRLEWCVIFFIFFTGDLYHW